MMPAATADRGGLGKAERLRLIRKRAKKLGLVRRKKQQEYDYDAAPPDIEQEAAELDELERINRLAEN